MADDNIVNRAQLARIIGKSSKTIQNWEGEGLPRLSGGGGRGNASRYDTVEVITWLLERERSKGLGGQSELGGVAMDPDTRLKILRGDKLSVEVDMLRGSVVPVDAAYAILVDIVGEVIAEGEALPSRVAPLLIDLTDPAEIRGVLFSENRTTRQAAAERVSRRLSDLCLQLAEEGAGGGGVGDGSADEER